MVGLLKQLSIVAGSYEAAFCSRHRWRLVGPMLTHLVEELIRADGLDRGAMIELALAARHQAQSAAEQRGKGRSPGERYDRNAWPEIERIGRLLFFLTFDKLLAEAPADEVAFMKQLADELRRRERQAALRAAMLAKRQWRRRRAMAKPKRQP